MLPFNGVESEFECNRQESSSTRNKVLVFSAHESDALLANKMLQNCGFQADWRTSLTEFLQSPVRGPADCNRHVATIVYYRSRINDTREFFSLKSLPGKRIIVFSDCSYESTIVSSLSNGAHHYFDSRESYAVSQARLEAALRNQIRLSKRSFRIGELYFDVSHRRVKRHDKWIALSPKEYDLAEYMFSNNDRLVTNGELLTSIWSLPAGVDSRRIDTAACRLRKKLDLSPSRGWELKKIRMVGYRLLRNERLSKRIPITTNQPLSELQVVI